MPTSTTNYGWNKPTVGADDDLWGGFINTDLDSIDTIVKTVSNTAIGDNRIINGDMRIDARNAGASGTAGNVYTVDRWKYGSTQASKGAWQRLTGAAPGFPYFLQFTSSSAYTPLTGDTFYFGQPIEADFVSDFAWGTASAQPVVLSFWVASSLTGTFSGSITNSGGTRSYPFTYSIPVATTWTRIVVTILGDTGGTWSLSGNGVGVNVFFELGGGATFRAPAGVWANGNFVGANGAVNVVATNSATFALTGVKLEIGSTATPYNRQSTGKSQADCERYFRWIGFNIGFTAAATGNNGFAPITFPAMRASPTIGALVVDPNTTNTSTNSSASGFQFITPYSAQTFATATAAGGVTVTGYRAPASAEL